MVTSSVRIAGVLLVFTYLVVPAACAVLLFRTVAARLVAGWILGFLGSVIGLLVSVRGDLPTGASIVTVFGAFMLLAALVSRWGRRGGSLKS